MGPSMDTLRAGNGSLSASHDHEVSTILADAEHKNGLYNTVYNLCAREICSILYHSRARKFAIISLRPRTMSSTVLRVNRHSPDSRVDGHDFRSHRGAPQRNSIATPLFEAKSLVYPPRSAGTHCFALIKAHLRRRRLPICRSCWWRLIWSNVSGLAPRAERG